MSTTTWRASLACVAAVAITAGCSSNSDTASTDTSSPAATSSSSPSGDAQTAADGAAAPDPADGGEQVDYDDPVAMKTKAEDALPYIVCDEDADVPEYDAYGALGVLCSGRNGEAVSFDVVDDDTALLDAVIAYEELNPGMTYAVGPSWIVGAENERTYAELLQVLDPDNAPEVPPLTDDEAAREYARMAENVNGSTEAFEWTDPTSSTLEDYQTACSDAAAGQSTFIAELERTDWPDEVSGAVDDLVTAVESDQDAYQACEDAGSVDEAAAALEPVYADATEAAAVREALGLDPA